MINISSVEALFEPTGRLSFTVCIALFGAKHAVHSGASRRLGSIVSSTLFVKIS